MDLATVRSIAGNGDNTMIAGTSSTAQLYGGSGNNMFIGGSGDTLMVGGKGNDQMYAGSGHDVMIGGGGSNYFDCGANGNAVVLDLNAKDGDIKQGIVSMLLPLNIGVPDLLNIGFFWFLIALILYFVVVFVV